MATVESCTVTGGGSRCAQPVEPNLLEKVDVRLRSFALVRIASVKNAGAVSGPGGAAAAGWILHAGDFVGEFLARIDLKKVQGALFTASFG